jgi:hypothetical protein
MGSDQQYKGWPDYTDVQAGLALYYLAKGLLLYFSGSLSFKLVMFYPV